MQAFPGTARAERAIRAPLPMSRCVSVVGAMLVGLILSVTPRNAAASPWLIVSACDSVNFGGAIHPRITFTIRNAYSPPSPDYSVCEVVFTPETPQSPGDTCSILDATAPPDWAAIVNPSGLNTIFIATNANVGCLGSGQTVPGFQFVLSKAHNCCFQMAFKGNLFEPFAQDEVCFTCDMPVPSKMTSWGTVKSIYRQ